MTLYLYETETKKCLLEIRDVCSYSANEVVSAHGVYGPFSDSVELSSKADCSETLRADWQAANPDIESRTAALESAVLTLMMGGMI